MQIEKDGLMLSTGKKINCYANVVGLAVDKTGAQDRLLCGYDGGIPVERHPDPYELNDERCLTPAECVELADFMLQQWAEFRAAALASEPKVDWLLVGGVAHGRVVTVHATLKHLEFPVPGASGFDLHGYYREAYHLHKNVFYVGRNSHGEQGYDVEQLIADTNLKPFHTR